MERKNIYFKIIMVLNKYIIIEEGYLIAENITIGEKYYLRYRTGSITNYTCYILNPYLSTRRVRITNEKELIKIFSNKETIMIEDKIIMTCEFVNKTGGIKRKRVFKPKRVFECC